VLNDLTFVQIDEFYPISSSQKNSFFDYVNKFYIDGFGLSRERQSSSTLTKYHWPMAFIFQSISRSQSGIFRCDSAILKMSWRSFNSNPSTSSINGGGDYEQRIRDAGGIGFFPRWYWAQMVTSLSIPEDHTFSRLLV